MARTLAEAQEAQRILDGVGGVWLVEGTFDQYGLATETKRYGDHKYTDSAANTWADLLSPRGLQMGMLQVNPRGGLAPVHSFTVQVVDDGSESILSDTHVLSGDTVVLYYLFLTGSELIADRIEVLRGQVERHSTKNNLWTWRCKGDSRKDLKLFPTDTIDPVTYKGYNPGAVIPECFGNLNVGPHDGAGRVAMAPCRFLDRFALTCTSSFQKKTGTTPFQWYSQVNNWGEVVTYTETAAGVLTVDDPARKMRLRPSRKKGSNDVDDWWKVKDLDHSVGAVIAASDNLDIWLSGAPKLGKMTAITVHIEATGGYDAEVLDDTTTKIAKTSYTGNQDLSLTLGDYNENWDMELLNVEIDGTGAATIWEIWLEIQYDDFLSFEEEPEFYQKVTGWEDQTAHYNDGAVIDSAGNVLRNPVHIFEAHIRGSNLQDKAEAKVNGTNLATAATSRTDWKFDYAFDRELGADHLNALGFEAGLFLFEQDNQWDCAAMDKTRDPQHFFHGDYHCAVSGNSNRPHTWRYDFERTPADESKIFNEIAIRFDQHPATDRYQSARIASGQYRLTGTCTLTAATSTLTDTSATFQTDNVLVDEIIYVEGYVDLKVTAITSETAVTVVAVAGGSLSDLTVRTYYLGPNLNGDCFISQQAFGNTIALGGNRQRTFLDDGGYKSVFIRDSDTAEDFRDHIIEWFSQPRDRIKFPLLHDGLRLQPGDIFLMDHVDLLPSQRPQDMTALTGSIVAGTTVLPVTAGTAGLLRTDDWCYLWDGGANVPECVKVSSTDTAGNTVTVVRGQLNTTAVAHASGKSIYRFKTKWICTGVQPFNPTDTRILAMAEEVPPWYLPVGRVVAAGYPNWPTATAQQRALSGWGTLRNGRVVDNEADSAISHVGPTTGRYTIT
ncbi:MAG: hypothetical protein QGH25_04535 [Candidatus Latescibacteria bacterium]|nr:hypothetical protein [Candidatus Latescibacterota bacterium]